MLEGTTTTETARDHTGSRAQKEPVQQPETLELPVVHPLREIPPRPEPEAFESLVVEDPWLMDLAPWTDSCCHATAAIAAPKPEYH